jgi:4-hydroxybenzoyl-CoA thioesterase
MTAMSMEVFTPPAGAFTRQRPIRFSHSDPAGIVYFPHYFDMFNALIEDWYGEELGIDYAKLLLGAHHGFPIVHAECDFKVPSRMGERLNLTLLLERIGRSSLSFLIIGHLHSHERLRARIVTSMIALATGKSMPMPDELRQAVEAYQRRCGPAT